MKKENQISAGSGSPIFLFLLYLFSSFFSGLLFSILALRAKSRNKTSFWWGLLSLICIVFFSVLSFSLFKTSSPIKDVVYYYVGLGSLITNSIAIVLLLITIFTNNKKNE
jgi:hypothetical protein